MKKRNSNDISEFVKLAIKYKMDNQMEKLVWLKARNSQRATFSGWNSSSNLTIVTLDETKQKRHKFDGHEGISQLLIEYFRSQGFELEDHVPFDMMLSTFFVLRIPKLIVDSHNSETSEIDFLWKKP